MNKKLWGGRFQSETKADVEQFLASVQFDAKLAYDDIIGSMAHVAMLAHCEILTKAECKTLQEGLQKIIDKIQQGKTTFNVADEDIHMNIERMLFELVGPVAGKLHTARSRNDQVALDMHLYLRRQVTMIIELLIKLQATLIHKAEQHINVILPGYTHLQRAQPVRLAHHLLAYAAMFERDCARLKSNWQRINVSPLGAAALAGTRFKIDPSYTANQLGFDSVYTNSMDAVSDRDFVIEFLANTALIMMHLSRLSEELILWSSQEFGFIQLDDAYCTGSSIMPQKKNPDVPELVRGKTGRVYGSLLSLLTTLKSLPLAYNKDMQEDKEPLFDTVITIQTSLAIFVPLLDTLKVNADKMYAAVDDGFLNATDFADYLTRSGMPFRDAHRIVGELVGYCVKKKCRLDDLSLAEIHKFVPDINEEIFQVIAAENVVEARSSSAGTALASVQHQLIIAKEKLTRDQNWLQEKQQLLCSIEKRFNLASLALHTNQS